MRELKGGGGGKNKSRKQTKKPPSQDKIKRESTDAGKMTCTHFHKVLTFFPPLFSSRQSQFAFLFMWK